MGNNTEILDLLNSEIMSLPKKWDGEFFPGFVKRLFDEYIEAIERLPDDSCYINVSEFGEENVNINDIKRNIPKIQIICDSLNDVIKQYYNGKPYNAYKVFENIMKDIRPWLNIMKKSGDITNIFGKDTLKLYRARVETKENISREDIFHIPLELRMKSSSYRYSIPGYPCIYLSTSAYACWEELGRPDLDTLIVSQFSLNRTSNQLSIHVVDFGMSPQYLSYLLKDERLYGEHYIINYFVFWPLLALCSIIVAHRENPLKPEYIIPQLMLQWIRNEFEQSNELYGIRYFSCCNNQYRPESFMHYNYVFPIEEGTAMQKNGFSPNLSEAFLLTKPIKWKEAKNMNYDSSIGYFKRKEDIYIPGLGNVGHENSEFDIIENILHNMDKEKIRI